MMNSRWQTNKIGLVNFWYYDEQEFPFAKGRMLLRGSNGSGKSVTMQSVVPLLLDGNVSPERLDPFGTRDRKMSNYLLEENDGREERTGYLYLEFRRKESETYFTIGMGLRARRGKPLDKWYFCLSDGRRVGKDFLLYKKTGEKIALSKKELENRIADGGKVFDRQLEYMEYVNRHIFGFETLEEYKELIDLLIQLRTPKLSKDFKPSVINDILSDSLQALSDDDLRPMSEAIENMDAMNLNLKAREEASQAAEKILRVFEQYNKYCLYEKASNYKNSIKKKKQLQEEMEEKHRQRQECQVNFAACEEKIQELDAKKISMEKERESLNKSDAVNLKARETQLVQEIAEYEKMLTDKEKFLSEKKEQQVEMESRIREEENRQYTKEQEIKEQLEEMQEQAEDMAFQEHDFFQEELLEHLEEPYVYDSLKQQFQDTKGKIDETFAILKQTREWDRQADEWMQNREQCGRQLNVAQRRQMELETLLVQTQNEWKENLIRWREQNKELLIDEDSIRQISHFADDYNEESDFTKVRQKVGTIYLDYKMKITALQKENRAEWEEKKQEYVDTQQELELWEQQREPQPPRAEAVQKNRQRLQELGIPYYEFYKIIEFGTKLSEEACNRLEEALLKMGILDALVVEEQYKNQVLQNAAGCEDRYLFVQQKKVQHSLLDVLELNDVVNDIFSNQRITGILSNIAYGEEGNCAIFEDGTYQMGVLSGTITGEHMASYLGTKARERTRLARIKECRDKMDNLQNEIQILEQDYKVLQERETILEKEQKAVPVDNDMREAWRLLVTARQEWERIHQEQLQIEQKLQQLKEKIRSQKEIAYTIAKTLYLDCTYVVFQEAAQAAEGYKEQLLCLIPAHEMYLANVRSLQSMQEQLENLQVDMDQILYDITTVRREVGKRKEEYDSVQSQLELTDYHEIQERLDFCMTWLHEYPEQVKQCVAKQTRNQERAAALEKQLEMGEKKFLECEKQCRYLEKCYEAEKKLGYVSEIAEMDFDAENVCNYLENEVKTWDKNTIIQNLNKVFFENRGPLNEYQLMQIELFEELKPEKENSTFSPKRMDITSRYQGTKIAFTELSGHLQEDIAELKELIKAGDQELFEDVLANTVSRKIRGRINASIAWVDSMNRLMNGMNTSSGLKLSLRWRSKTAETEQQLDTKELVGLLKKDYRLMSEEEAARLSGHFRSKVEEARRRTRDSAGMVSFYQVMKETLDYRKWFEFQLLSQKTGERQKELTNSVFGTFSGGEKAMAMYVPLFSAVVAKYQGGRPDAPRLISLDEAFAGVDNRNIRDMFRLMREFEFDFIINSQVLWGDCDTLDALAIYQLQRPQNAKFVAVMPYLWNGHDKEALESENVVEEKGAALEQAGRN